MSNGSLRLPGSFRRSGICAPGFFVRRRRFSDSSPRRRLHAQKAAELEAQTACCSGKVKLGSPNRRRSSVCLRTPSIRSGSRPDGWNCIPISPRSSCTPKGATLFAIEEKSHEADLTSAGRLAISPNDPDQFVLPDPPTLYSQIDTDSSLPLKERLEKKQALQQSFEDRAQVIHAISQLLKAYCLYQRDVQYVVTPDNKVVIVDEHTGRLMSGRRWSDGLHQAVEAKGRGHD